MPRPSSPRCGRGAVGEDGALLDLGALVDHDALVEAGVLVGPAELGQPVDLAAERNPQPVELAGDVLDRDVLAGDFGHHTVALGQQDVAGVAGRPGLDTGADEGGLGLDQGHRLLLHVGAHEGPVGVVVLDEGDEGGGDGHDLLGRHVHQVHFGRWDEVDLAGGAVAGGSGGVDPNSGAEGGAAHEHPVVDAGCRLRPTWRWPGR